MTSRDISFTSPSFRPNDFDGDGISDILWRNTADGIVDWTMNGGTIAASGFAMSNGVIVAPDASWSAAGLSDFDGDGRSDILWRNTSGEVAVWLMNGAAITSSADVTANGVAVRPDASWSVAGVGDFNGDGMSDVLWRNSSGEVAVWSMGGTTIAASADVTANGAAVRPDASWSVAGIGRFNGDNAGGNADVLWRNSATGELTVWFMSGSSIASSADLTLNGVAVRPDASWSIVAIDDFNNDKDADILWRNSDGTLTEWALNGAAIGASGPITFNGAVLAPDASWHVVEIGDFNGDGRSDILWRNDSGALAEWLMSGNTVISALAPSSNGIPITPDSSFVTQAKPTDFA